MKLLILIILTSATWITAVVQWFQHDDHVALGFLMLSMALGNYTNTVAREWTTKRKGGRL